MKRAVLWLIGLAGLCAAGLWVISTPPAPSDNLSGLSGDADAGRLVFAAAGCASCHTAPNAPEENRLILSGGEAFVTDFGTFFAPNISPHDTAGIGGWSDAQIIHAVQAGVSPEGAYYYPAFPSHAYGLARTQDIADLVAYLRTLPADATPSKAHEVGFPFNIRRSLWGWRVLFSSSDWVVVSDDSQVQRGRYLVESLGHCTECHTPRNALGGLNTDKWLQGAPLPSGKGRVPGISAGTLDWSETDIAEYLSSGFTPEYDVAGGKMASVVANTSQLSDADRMAIAAYLKAVE